MYIAACIAVFLVAFAVNMSCITVLYHRGLAHNGVTLSPTGKTFIKHFGNWLTGLDPKGWVCMHRLHHTHSDGPLDPHSPSNLGIFGVLFGQLRAYEKILVALHRKNKRYTHVVHDIDFDISWLNRKKMWWMPYVLHISIALVLGLTMGWWLMGGAYFIGIMSHPIEGWLVNSFGHASGPRNFDTPDDSRNNPLVGLFLAGEGYQNNHHRYPNSPKFSVRRWEFDFGYLFCLFYEKIGFVRIERDKIAPPFEEPVRKATRPAKA